jgi:hypothetical protein
MHGDYQPATQHASLSCTGTSQPAARLHTSESSQELTSRKSEGAPTPQGPQQAADHHQGTKSTRCFPLTQAATNEVENRKSRLCRLATLYHTESFQPCWKPHRGPLQAKSSLASSATSVVRRRCPSPHWRLPSNTRHRGTLQVDDW